MNPVTRVFIVLLAGSTAALPVTHAGDWPHMMGPHHDRKSTGEITPTWSQWEPTRAWEIECSGGFGSFVTGDDKAFVVVPTRGPLSSAFQPFETIMAVDLSSGEELWQRQLGRAGYDGGAERGADGNDGGDGPRATPTYHEGRVFVLGGRFDLHALDANTGEVLWARDLAEEFGARHIRWSNAAAPLVTGDRVIVAGGGAGQTFLAFNTRDGGLIWSTGDDEVSHSTPVLANIHGRDQVLFMVHRGLVAIDPESGGELWHYPFAFRVSVGASPVVWNDIVHCTAGYGIGGGACRVTFDGREWHVQELWRLRGNRETASHWMTAVSHEGYLYGNYGFADFGKAAFKCIDIRTGNVEWEQPGFGHGQTAMVDGQLFAMTDYGQLSVIDPSPHGFREIARMQVVDGKCWAVPVVSDGRLLVRSTTRGVCWEL